MSEGLAKIVNRAKARWLRRTVYNSSLSPTAKLLAYATADHLNCVTLDAWPAQTTLAALLGRKSTKTIQRATKALVAAGAIECHQDRGSTRYRPLLIASDWDNPDRKGRQLCSERTDKNVHQSFLEIHLQSDSTELPNNRPSSALRTSSKPSERGAIELKLASAIGPDGWDVLGRLQLLGEGIVDRLCRHFDAGLIGKRELEAARLAAKQAPGVWFYARAGAGVAKPNLPTPDSNSSTLEVRDGNASR